VTGGNRYRTMLYIGTVAGVFAGSAVAGERGLAQAQFALTAIALLVPALIGARLLYVAQHLDVYRAEPRRIIKTSEGGSALFGGLVASFAVSVPLLSITGIPFWTFWDAAAVTMLVGLIFTRVGCLMNGCCAGRPTRGPLGLWLPNLKGECRRRYPTQLLEAGWGSLLLASALLARNGLLDGTLFAAIVALYCAGRTVLNTTREDAKKTLAA
jgi:phosphatidylglycerol:prolipoprotein diacylglycerol transferase